GVREVLQIEEGVAVVADSTWSAMRGRDALRVVWDEGALAHLSSADIARTLAELAQRSGVTGRHEGDVPAALAGAVRTLEADYEVPYQAHACMEPMTCTAHVRPDGCEVWAPTQTPRSVQAIAAEITGLPLERVAVPTTLFAGRPWPGVDPAQVQQWIPEETMDGAANLQYAIPNLHVDYVRAEIGIPVGWWRSVYNSQNGFANESFLDELAAAGGQDPYELRR